MPRLFVGWGSMQGAPPHPWVQGKQKGRDQDIGDKAEGMGQDMPVYKAIQGGSLGWRGEAPNLNFLVPSILVPYCCCFPALVA